MQWAQTDATHTVGHTTAEEQDQGPMIFFPWEASSKMIVTLVTLPYRNSLASGDRYASKGPHQEWTEKLRTHGELPLLTDMFPLPKCSPNYTS